VKRSNLLRRAEFDRTGPDSDVDETRRQMAEWAAKEIEANARFESQFMTSRSLTTDGCIVYFFFAAIVLALILLLE
jgi:hypothetical protein